MTDNTWHILIDVGIKRKKLGWVGSAQHTLSKSWGPPPPQLLCLGGRDLLHVPILLPTPMPMRHASDLISFSEGGRPSFRSRLRAQPKPIQWASFKVWGEVNSLSGYFSLKRQSWAMSFTNLHSCFLRRASQQLYLVGGRNLAEKHAGLHITGTQQRCVIRTPIWDLAVNANIFFVDCLWWRKGDVFNWQKIRCFAHQGRRSM